MPTAVLGAGRAVLGSILIAVNHLDPFLADNFRVNEHVHLLTVKI